MMRRTKLYRCITCLELVNAAECYHLHSIRIRKPSMSTTFIGSSPAYDTLDADGTPRCGLIHMGVLYASKM